MGLINNTTTTNREALNQVLETIESNSLESPITSDLVISSNSFIINGLQTHDDNIQALAAGLTMSQLYQDASGFLRIVVV